MCHDIDTDLHSSSRNICLYFSFLFVHFSAIIHHHKGGLPYRNRSFITLTSIPHFLSWEAAELAPGSGRPGHPLFPSVIGGSERHGTGLFSPKSPSAAALGVCTGEPLAQAQAQVPDLKIYAPQIQHLCGSVPASSWHFSKNMRPRWTPTASTIVPL